MKRITAEAAEARDRPCGMLLRVVELAVIGVLFVLYTGGSRCVSSVPRIWVAVRIVMAQVYWPVPAARGPGVRRMTPMRLAVGYCERRRSRMRRRIVSRSRCFGRRCPCTLRGSPDWGAWTCITVTVLAFY